MGRRPNGEVSGTSVDPTTRIIRANLVALDQPPQTHEEQIAEITRQAEAAVAQVLAEDDAEARAGLAKQLEQVAQQVEAGEGVDSLFLALAAHLRALAARLHEHSRSSAPSGTGTQDGSAG
jgi:hypothetical protein